MQPYKQVTFYFIRQRHSLHCALAAAQCIVIDPVCVCVFVCLWVCYHDNSKLRASTISSWLNFGGPAPPGRGSAAGRNFWLRLTTASGQCLRLRALFSFLCFCDTTVSYHDQSLLLFSKTIDRKESLNHDLYSTTN